MLVERASPKADQADLLARARQTLAIYHRWGYAPSVEALGASLLQGPVPPGILSNALRDVADIGQRGAFVYLIGHETLLENSKRRAETHKLHDGWARSIALQYARDLARACPLAESICLSGSASSGGYDLRDDIDLDVFVRDHAKYLVYALALVLGLRLSLRMRRILGLRKVICINVLWTPTEYLPFSRRDEDLAFELLRCEPLIGSGQFARMLSANPWVAVYFPQLLDPVRVGEPLPAPSVIGRAVARLAKHRGLLRAVDELCRVLTHLIYSGVHAARRRSPESRARLSFLKSVKYPYEVFQD